MTFLDIFAGIGGFRRGLERSGHRCVGHVEIDKHANKSYLAMYELEPCPYQTGANENTCKLCKQEEQAYCDGTNCNGEWFAKDIKKLSAGEIPHAEIWTFGFPCVDISICSSRQLGLDGARSGLFFEVTRLLQGQSAEHRPQWVIVENVKRLLSIASGSNFTTVLCALWDAGYDCEWMCVNSKAFNVPQNRERVYLIGHLRGNGGQAIFPINGAGSAPVVSLRSAIR